MSSRFPRGSRSIVFLLWAFAFMSYLLRINITIAQQYMARELVLTDIQVGYIFAVFLVGYSIFQVPAGVLGDRFGPRVVLTVSGLIWAVTTLLTGLVPGLLLKGALLAMSSLLVLRFIHGLAEAATYPVAMSAVAEWFKPSRHAFITALIFTGSTLGSAFAPPLVATVMSAFGWRATFYLTALFPVVVATLWWFSSRKDEDRGATIPIAQTELPARHVNWLHLLVRRNVFFLCLSYFLYCYAISIFVYWLFKYLVDVRHLSIVNGGWAASLPWIVASVFVPIFGWLSGRLSRRRGPLLGRRQIATLLLVISALLMFVGAGAQTTPVALVSIALSVGLLFSTESSYWSTAIDLAHEDAGAASGLMNLAGNLGGVLSSVLVPVLVLRVGWFYALLSGSLFAFLAAGSWFLLKADFVGEWRSNLEPVTVTPAATNRS